VGQTPPAIEQKCSISAGQTNEVEIAARPSDACRADARRARRIDPDDDARRAYAHHADDRSDPRADDRRAFACIVESSSNAPPRAEVKDAIANAVRLAIGGRC